MSDKSRFHGRDTEQDFTTWCTHTHLNNLILKKLNNYQISSFNKLLKFRSNNTFFKGICRFIFC